MPSSHVMPSFNVNFHVLPPLDAVPVSVAMSGTSDVPSLLSGDNWYVVSERMIVAPRKARSSPV